VAVTPLDDALSRIGDRWTLLVVDALMAGPLRFGELSERVDGIAPNVLSKRLKQLESDGIVLGTPYSERPVRVAYALTGLGRELAGALSLIASWGTGLAEHHHDHHHAACGSPLVARLWCPTCDQPVDDADATGDIPA
jgi:DNA-binding HxlR family transcriptional regulator